MPLTPEEKGNSSGGIGSIMQPISFNIIKETISKQLIVVVDYHTTVFNLWR